MPLFEYRCRECGTLVEKIVLGQEEAFDCPECGSANMDKVISATADYRNEGGLPGPGDTACCGSAPGQAAGCAGPGSCCGHHH